jgi:osmoprotectant transport system ATP-binding protein
VVLLDEPLGALDALTRLALQTLLEELKVELGKTLLMVTHDLAEALRLGDTVGVMHGGRLLQVGSPAELLAAPAPGYVADLLGLLERAGTLGEAGG